MNTAALAVSGLLLAGALSPGPNNVVVMRTAARVGLAGVLPDILGVLLGGLCLLGLSTLGLEQAFVLLPELRLLVSVLGAAYLLWLGLRLMHPRGNGAPQTALPAGTWGLFAFQFLNPKSWVLAWTLIAAEPARHAPAMLAALVPLYLLIPGACLLLWASLGTLLSSILSRPRVALWSDRILGALLMASAALLLL